jgi:hypothetical protein
MGPHSPFCGPLFPKRYIPDYLYKINPDLENWQSLRYQENINLFSLNTTANLNVSESSLSRLVSNASSQYAPLLATLNSTVCVSGGNASACIQAARNQLTTLYSSGSDSDSASNDSGGGIMVKQIEIQTAYDVWERYLRSFEPMNAANLCRGYQNLIRGLLSPSAEEQLSETLHLDLKVLKQQPPVEENIVNYIFDHYYRQGAFLLIAIPLFFFFFLFFFFWTVC